MAEDDCFDPSPPDPPYVLSRAEKRDLGQIEMMAKGITIQVGHLRRNVARGYDDSVRFSLLDVYARRLIAVTARARRRWEKANPTEPMHR